MKYYTNRNFYKVSRNGINLKKVKYYWLREVWDILRNDI